MKSYYLIFIFLFYSVLSAWGQNMLTYQTHAYLSGDVHPYVLIKNLDQVSEGEAGSDITWDFTYLTDGDSLTSYLLDATIQEGNEHFMESNIVISEHGRNYFCDVSQTGMDEYGYIVSTNIFKYDNPIKRFSFPFIYGQKIEGAYSGQRIGSTAPKIHGVYKSEIDGYGTLILPGNVTYEHVLRVRTSKKNENSSAEEVSYRWYSQFADPVLRYPLLSIAKIESSTKSLVRLAGYHVNSDPLAEKGLVLPKELNTAKAELFKLKVYPNPFVYNVNVEYKLPEEAKVTVVVSDALGRIIETLVDKYQEPGNYTAEFKPNGGFVYFITTFVDGEIVKSKKLIHVKR